MNVQNCEHPQVTAYSVTEGEDAGRVSLWACATCMRRFYPACPSCVDVGHRNVVHPAATQDGGPWDAASSAEELVRLAEQHDYETHHCIGISTALRVAFSAALDAERHAEVVVERLDRPGNRADGRRE